MFLFLFSSFLKLPLTLLNLVLKYPLFLQVPAHIINSNQTRQPDRVGKRVLLVLLSVVFGIELGLKFATKTVIYALNPCHVLTAVQVR